MGIDEGGKDMPRLTKAEAGRRAIGLCEDAIDQLEHDRYSDAEGFLAAASAHIAAVTTAPVKVRKVSPLAKDPRYSSSLGLGLRILALFSDEDTLLGIANVADALKAADSHNAPATSRSTVHRYMTTLCQLGQLEQPEGTRKYRRAGILNGDAS
jgi:hypothetical protein